MVSEYTAEDFANARCAESDKYGLEVRMSVDAEYQWTDFQGDCWADESMAEPAFRWTPVVESRITEHTLRDSQEKAARKREKLVDHIADQDRVIRRRNDEIAVLRLELAD